MKKHILLFSNLIIILSIIAGFTCTVSKNTRMYQRLSEEYLENIIELADINITNNIENSMTKPITVSKTMANDEFLKSWIYKEKENEGNSTYLEQLYSYLKAYQLKYNYTTVFCVSAQTGNYYYQDGLNKTISENDEHDVWYYNFINSDREYDIQVDTNQANNDTVTMFVNFRVEDSDNTLLGVIGVGLEISAIKDMINTYEQNYDLSVYIINAGGSENSFTGSTELFVNESDLSSLTGIDEKIELNNTSESKMQWFTSENERKCLITKYNDTLGWYLILEKDTNSIYSTFQQGIVSNMLFMLVTLIVCIMVTTAVFLIFNRRKSIIDNTDELTGLPNRKLFFKNYPAVVRKHKECEKSLFMLDIDNFKHFNDTYGHMFGNTVLSLVGNNLKGTTAGRGTVARWGGDEFVGILDTPVKEAEQILKRFMESLNVTQEKGCANVTVSIGLVAVDRKLGTEEMINKADEIMYCSKNNGRNQITVCTADNESKV